MCRGHDSLAPQSGAHSAGEEIEAVCEAGNGVAGGRSGGVSHMTCKDFRDDLKPRADTSAKVLSESREMAEHARACPESSGSVRDEQLLEKHLDLVRAAVPEVPPSLDSAVLANYRRYLAERPAAIDHGRWRVRLENALPWTAALAFAAMVAYLAMAFFMPHFSTGWANGKDRTPAGGARAPVVAEKPVPPPAPIAKATPL